MVDLAEVGERARTVGAALVEVSTQAKLVFPAHRSLPPDLTARLAAAQVYVSVRGQSIRVSPHAYNTQEDVRRLVVVLGDTLLM